MNLPNRRKFTSATLAAVAQIRVARAQPQPGAGTTNVRELGAVGDGAADETASLQRAIDTAFGSASAFHGTSAPYRNQVLYFPPGKYRITRPLRFTQLQGARIMGAGRFATTIQNDTPGQSVFATNGCAYTHWEGIHLKGAAGSTLFDLNWDGSSGGAALQSNSFVEMYFEGGDTGMEVGKGRFMGSENLFQNCFWSGNRKNGLLLSNQNALQQTIVGGNFQTCGNAINVVAGSVPAIVGVGFQQSAGYDIVATTDTSNCMSVQGCRSESPNFINTGCSMNIYGCLHQSPNAKGIFLQAYGGLIDVSACRSTYGSVSLRWAPMISIRNCLFNRVDWIAADQLWSQPGNRVPANVELENVWHGDFKFIPKQRITAAGTFDYNVTRVG